MKRFALAALLAALALAAWAAPARAPAAAKDVAEEARELFRSLSLEPKELDQIDRILDRNEDDIAKARAEIQILQARLTRLLLEKDPQVEQVRPILKDSLDWELKIRLAQVERQIAIRKVIGEERWSALYKLARLSNILERESRPAQAAAGSKAAKDPGSGAGSKDPKAATEAQAGEYRARVLAVVKRLL